MRTDQRSRLRKRLDRIYRNFDFAFHLRHDPLVLVHGYSDPQDQEIVALIAALFSYGRVDLFKKALQRQVFGMMGESPHEFIRNFARRSEARFGRFRYRFNSAGDLILLLRALRSILYTYGNLENLFLIHHKPFEGSVKSGLEGFVGEILFEASRHGSLSEGFLHLLPRPSRGSACKRLNLFLRWMVRNTDVDLGLWKNPSRDALVIPLDTHIARIAACLGLTGRRSNGWRTAEEITNVLRELSPTDPLKYDFVLSHHGIAGLCRHDRTTCSQCELSE